ncbi:hypothetical protein D3C86_1874450 [compost metagenome]
MASMPTFIAPRTSASILSPIMMELSIFASALSSAKLNILGSGLLTPTTSEMKIFLKYLLRSLLSSFTSQASLNPFEIKCKL